jgi:hypothetical protein
VPWSAPRTNAFPDDFAGSWPSLSGSFLGLRRVTGDAPCTPSVMPSGRKCTRRRRGGLADQVRTGSRGKIAMTIAGLAAALRGMPRSARLLIDTPEGQRG